MDNVAQLIANTGFPIAMCLIIMYYWNNQYTATISDLRETVSRLTEAVLKNTQAVLDLQYSIKKECDTNGEE